MTATAGAGLGARGGFGELGDGCFGGEPAVDVATKPDEDGNRGAMTAPAGAGLGARGEFGELGDGCSGGQPAIRSVYVNRHLAGDLVQPEALGGRQALA